MKPVQLSDETHKKLRIYTAQEEFKSFDQAISKLIEGKVL